ncbi:hypothetical protein ABIF26_009550 [Bradyrhizobium elkanii]|uniref:hypothetical protein n=1 Tax=Bradyrhizobium elkanii TaxID=29448 RepID=UPI003518CBED
MSKLDREEIAKRLFDRDICGLAYWEQMTEPNKDFWLKRADQILADQKKMRTHYQKHPLPVTFEKE